MCKWTASDIPRHLAARAGWATKNNGSLGDVEIDSLVDLIKKYKKILAPPGLR
jgi:hypothetical protein